MQEIKNTDGTYKTLDELRQDAIELIAEELDCMTEYDMLDVGNRYREEHCYPQLNTFDEDNVNDALDGLSPWEIIELEIRPDHWGDDYFTYDGYDFDMVSDIWDNIDLEELAEAIIDGDFDAEVRDIRDLVDEYEEAKDYLENLNKYREQAREVMAKFVNCEADWKDLYACLDRLVNTDEAWS